MIARTYTKYQIRPDQTTESKFQAQGYEMLDTTFHQVAEGIQEEFIYQEDLPHLEYAAEA